MQRHQKKRTASEAEAALTHKNLPLLLLATREEIMAYFRPVFRENELTEQQWRIIRSLYENGDMAVGDLGERCYILSPSIAGILRRMREAKLITKRIDKGDARRAVISLTETGRRKLEQTAIGIEAAYARLEKGLGPAKVQGLYSALSSVLEKLQSKA